MKELIKVVVNALEEVKAKDIRIYDMDKTNPLFSYAIVATVQVSRQMKGLVSKVYDYVEEMHFEVRGVEGTDDSDWTLLDLNDIIVNIFTSEARLRYDLDRSWAKYNEIDPNTMELIKKTE